MNSPRPKRETRGDYGQKNNTPRTSNSQKQLGREQPKKEQPVTKQPEQKQPEKKQPRVNLEAVGDFASVTELPLLTIQTAEDQTDIIQIQAYTNAQGELWWVSSSSEPFRLPE